MLRVWPLAGLVCLVTTALVGAPAQARQASSYPHASDLWHSPTWQGVLRRKDGGLGERSVEAYLRRPEYELYDAVADPHEMRNLAGEPRLRRVLEELKERLRRVLEQSNDPWLVESAR